MAHTPIPCPRCSTQNPQVAAYCAHCGLSLAAGIDGSSGAGRVRDPQALDAPAGYTQLTDAADLYYRCESPLGGEALLATEGFRIWLFNAGYALRDVTINVRGLGEDGRQRLALARDVAELPRGEEVSFEVPSYEVPVPIQSLTLTLDSARFKQQN